MWQMLGAHIIGFSEKGTVNNLSRVAPLADRMDMNDFKFSRSPYAIDSAGSSVSSRVQRSNPERHSPEHAEAAPTPILEGPGEAQHAGSPPQTRMSPPSEGPAACRCTKIQVIPNSALNRTKHHQSNPSNVPGILYSSLPKRGCIYASKSLITRSNWIPSL